MTESVPWWFVKIGDEEIARVADAIRDRNINCGPLCRELELRFAEILGVPHAVLTTSGSAALLLSLWAAGVGPGDEVVMPAAGFVATAHAAMLSGAQVRLVDVCPNRPLIDVEELDGVLNDRTKAVVPVHLAGAACDVPALQDRLKGTGVKIIEDAAQALGSRSPRGAIGSEGEFAGYSLGITKLITTGEGGLVAARTEEGYERLLKLRNQGVLLLTQNVFDNFGFNLRPNDLTASIALSQTERIEDRMEACRSVYRFYSEALADLHWLRMMEVRIEDGEMPLWSQIICADRDNVQAHLAEAGIVSRAFHPVLARSPHLHSARDFPRAEAFADFVLTLPSGPDQPRSNLERTSEVLHQLSPKIGSDLEDFDRIMRTDYATN
jgi:dTDP-4-amino-4,6-dideoxygalactose transaminase